MAITKDDLEKTLDRLASDVKMKTTAKLIKGKGYTNSFLKIEYAYGKQKLVIVHKGSTSEFDISHLMTKQELYDYMRGMMKGIELYKRK